MLLKLVKLDIPNARHFLKWTNKQNVYLQPRKLLGGKLGINTRIFFEKCPLKVKLSKASFDDIKDTILCLARVLARQCQVYSSQQLRHSLQLYSFYSRTWGEEVAHRMFSGVKRSILNKSKSMLLSAACLLSYNWEQDNIPDLKMGRAVEEYTNIGNLCSETVVCDSCRKRQVIDQKVKGVDYCKCGGETSYADPSRQYECWEPFLERENIIVWRKKHEKYPYLYCYKVYGTYEDMSPAAFMEVQLNTASRTHWDSTALELSVLSSHPETNSDLIYWIVKFPQFFSDRDYVYARRFRVDEEQKEIVIVSEATNGVQWSRGKGLHRVNEYWSMMVIRANEDFHKPGMSYTLTYFDNPGMSLPAAVTNYVASTGFPGYLQRVYTRAMDLQRQWEKGDDVYVTLPQTLRFSPQEVVQPFLSLLPEENLVKSDIKTIPALCKDENEDDLNQNQEVMNQMTISKFIKNLVKSPDRNTESSTDPDNKDIKIPFRYKGIVLDLLEAIEVISPDAKEKNFLMHLIDSLLWERDSNSNIDTHTPLWQRVKALHDKVLNAINKASKKREESLDQMREIKPKDHYDHYLYDQEAVEMLGKLFKTMNEVLRADKDYRTGKEIEGIRSSETEAISFSPVAQFGKSSEEESCACCACQHCYSPEKTSSNLWLPKRLSIYFWSSNAPSEESKLNYEELCPKCAKDHKSLANLTSNGSWWSFFGFGHSVTKGNEDDQNTISINSEHSSFNAWPLSKSETQECVGVECSLETPEEPTTDGAESIDSREETNSWIWYPIQGSLEVLTWLSSMWLSHSI